MVVPNNESLIFITQTHLRKTFHRMVIVSAYSYTAIVFDITMTSIPMVSAAR